MPSDDLGHPCEIHGPARRVVSLVPSLTEAIAATRSEALVGATDWCTHPPDLDVARIRGTKNPNREAISELRPDLVIANQEENRELDVARMRDAGNTVWVTRIDSLDNAFASLRRLFTEALCWETPTWLDDAERIWSTPVAEPRGTVVVPIWRDPWMVVGEGTFTSDVLSRLGWRNAVTETRYPHIDLADIDRPEVDLVLLPDEPYVFSAGDGPEAFTQTRTELVNGRLLTWYGPSLIEAYDVLSALR